MLRNADEFGEFGLISSRKRDDENSCPSYNPCKISIFSLATLHLRESLLNWLIFITIILASLKSTPRERMPTTHSVSASARREMRKILPSFAGSHNSWELQKKMNGKNYDSGNYISWFELMACWMFWKKSATFPPERTFGLLHQHCHPTSCDDATRFHDTRWSFFSSIKKKLGEEIKMKKFFMNLCALFAYYNLRLNFNSKKNLTFERHPLH